MIDQSHLSVPASAPEMAAQATPRVALALGLAGALGDELLAALVAAPDVRLVHVGLKQPIASGTAKYRPWVVGSSSHHCRRRVSCV